MTKFEFQTNGAHNIRLDKFLSEEFAKIKPEINRSNIQKLISKELVVDEKNNIITSSSYKIKPNQNIIVTLPEAKPSRIAPKKIDFEIIFEDDDLIVINKPANLTVHPGAGNQEDTLVNALLFTHQDKLSSISGEARPGIVHRLDKDTTGLMLVAKNDLAHQALSQDLQDRNIKRSYLAFIYGAFEPKYGKIETKIARNRHNRLKMSVTRGQGRTAITNYETVESYLDNFVSLIKCNLETGRTHQIRVHMENAKHSIIGDQAYGACKKVLPKTVELSKEKQAFIKNFPRQALHSFEITFSHPRTKKEMSFTIGLPNDLLELQKCLK
ncbi:MAG: RluA family pseudouridine synthase [Rickettsiales bacterium]|nr:RluA family pseudouridine synthase [Rickettsiales bacterium]